MAINHTPRPPTNAHGYLTPVERNNKLVGDQQLENPVDTPLKNKLIKAAIM